MLSEFAPTAIAIVLDGMVFASWLFIVALGLTLIFGVMQILNVAHGSFYAFGAYVAANAIGVYYEAGYAPLGGFALIFASALIVGLVLGLALERGLLRFMYGRDEVLMALVTFATFLMLEDAILLIWGGDPYFAYQPYGLLGISEIGPLIYSNYDLSLIALAFALCALTWWILNRTRQGKLLIAVIHDRELAAAFGINVTRVYTATFVVGAMLGALGGAVTAPMISVTPGIGVEVIVLAFAIVVIGGMGSIWGAVIGAVVVGISRAAAVHLLPEVELFVIYAVMALVLAIKPQGLFSRAQARKI
jgi:branched-chain amino acid transport system permease protein